MTAITKFPDSVAVAPELDRHAAVLAELRQIHADYAQALADNGQLRADLHREQDRCTMLIEERDRYRHESVRFRKRLLQQATEMSNAYLILQTAKETLQEMDEIDVGETPPSGAIDALEQEFRKGSAA
jgi:hypothetical protein